MDKFFNLFFNSIQTWRKFKKCKKIKKELKEENQTVFSDGLLLLLDTNFSATTQIGC